MYTDTKNGKLMEMLQKMSQFDIHIDRFVTVSKGEETVYEVDLYVRNSDYLDKVFLELNKLSYVIKAERLFK